MVPSLPWLSQKSSVSATENQNEKNWATLKFFKSLRFKLCRVVLFGKKANESKPINYCQNSNSQILPLSPEPIS